MPERLPKPAAKKKNFTVFFLAPRARKHCARKQRNLRVDTSPTVLNRTSLHHLSSSTCLKASRSLARKKNFGLYFCSRAGAEAVQNHSSHQILNFTARARDHISLHRLSSSVHLKPSRSALWLTVFSCQLVFLILRGSRVEQCRISAVCNPAGSQLQKSTWIELLWPSEAFPRLAVANSFFVQTVPRELNAESKSARLQDKTVSHG